METKKVKALLAAVECGSLTAAAEQLGYTQSGMTHMMNALEEELGISLLIRSKTGIRLSPAGQLLLPEMTSLVSAADALVHDAERLHNRNHTRIRIGSHSSIVREWLPEILAEFRSKYPDVDESITLSSIQGLYNSLRTGDLDCALISYDRMLCQHLTWTPLRRDNYVAVIPADFPVEGDVFPVSAFDNTDFLMPTSGFDTLVYKIFQDSGHEVNANIKNTNMEDAVIVSMVAHGLGVTILTDLIMQGMRTENVRVLPLDFPCYRELGIVASDISQNEKSVKHFTQCAQAAIEKLYGRKA